MSAPDVDQLRQFVDVRRPQPLPESCDPGIVAQLELRCIAVITIGDIDDPLLGIRHHRTQLAEREMASVPTEALLPEHRSAIAELHRQGRLQRDRRVCDAEQRAKCDIERALGADLRAREAGALDIERRLPRHGQRDQAVVRDAAHSTQQVHLRVAAHQVPHGAVSCDDGIAPATASAPVGSSLGHGRLSGGHRRRGRPPDASPCRRPRLLAHHAVGQGPTPTSLRHRVGGCGTPTERAHDGSDGADDRLQYGRTADVETSSTTRTTDAQLRRSRSWPADRSSSRQDCLRPRTDEVGSWQCDACNAR